MILNSKTKELIKVGSVLKDSGNIYTVTLKDIQGKATYLTTHTSSGQNLYYMPISFYYGCRIIKE